MKQTIRNPHIERRAVRAAQRAMDRRPGVGPEFWRGVANTLLITGGIVGFGLLTYWVML